MPEVPAVALDDLFRPNLSHAEAEVRADQMRRQAIVLRDGLFWHQRLYLSDEHDYRVVLTPRRVGKTHVFGIEHLIGLQTVENYAGAYISITRTQAKRNLWKPLLAINEKYGLGLNFQHTELKIESPLGGTLWLGGALTAADIERYRGLALDLVTVDEGGSHAPDNLYELLWEILDSCLYDRQGKLTLGGTPGPVEAGPYFDASGDPAFEVHETEEGPRCSAIPFVERNHEKWDGVQSTWSFHAWTMKENTAVPHLWDRAMRAHKLRGGSDHDPVHIRERLGKWAADSSAFMYKYDPYRNGWQPTGRGDYGLPEGHKWHYIGGVDLGYEDAFAIEVAAWSDTCHEFFHIYEYLECGLDPDSMLAEIKRVSAKFKFDALVCDTGGLGRPIFEHFRRHGVAITPIAKTDKRDYIERMNSELLSGRCKVLKGSQLEGQLRTVQWEDPRTKKRAHPKMDDDACDAWLYVTRYALHQFARSPVKAPEEGTQEWEAQRRLKEETALERAMARTRTTKWWERESMKVGRRHDRLQAEANIAPYVRALEE